MRLIVYLLLLNLTSLATFSSDKINDLQLGSWDYEWMKKVKIELKNGSEKFLPAYKQLLKDADSALNKNYYTVTSKTMVPPSNSKNDYMSMGPYWWPDPTKKDGLPYVNRDGEVNPEREQFDRPKLIGMVNSVRNLSLGWFFSDNYEYAKKASELLKIWFLNPSTLMNPHLEYAQAIPGRTPGRHIGIIDAKSFYELVDAISILEISGSLSPNEIAEIKLWFKKYFEWLITSEHGQKENNHENNHSVAYDVQAAGIAYFLGNSDFVAQKVRELPRKRIDTMLEKDGSQPYELIRTKAFGYSVGNLYNLFEIAELGLNVGVNIFNYSNIQGSTLKDALNFLIQYAGKENTWPYQQITDWNEEEKKLGCILRKAGHIYNDDEYQLLWEDYFQARLQDHWILLVEPGFI
jgi:hypothetical protein